MNAEQSQIWRSLADDPGNYYCQAEEFEREAFREWLKVLLKERPVMVDFVKANGEFRSMECTLSTDHGAKYTVNENQDRPRKQPNPEVCVVWDVNQSAWRSFRWDRIKRIQFNLG